jgi:hypothetical protein
MSQRAEFIAGKGGRRCVVCSELWTVNSSGVCLRCLNLAAGIAATGKRPADSAAKD